MHMLFRNMSLSKTDSKVFKIFIVNKDRKTFHEFVKSLVTQNTKTKFIDLSKNLSKGDRIEILHEHFDFSCKGEDFRKLNS